MAAKTAKKRTQSSAPSVRGAGPRGRPFEKGHTAGFKPGQSGNPGGRPKNAESIVYHLRQVLAEEDKDGVSNARRVAENLVALAVKDNVPALREIIERMDGKVSQPLDIDDLRSQARAIAKADGATDDEAEEAVREVEAMVRGERQH